MKNFGKKITKFVMNAEARFATWVMRFFDSKGLKMPWVLDHLVDGIISRYFDYIYEEYLLDVKGTLRGYLQ